MRLALVGLMLAGACGRRPSVEDLLAQSPEDARATLQALPDLTDQLIHAFQSSRPEFVERALPIAIEIAPEQRREFILAALRNRHAGARAHAAGCVSSRTPEMLAALLVAYSGFGNGPSEPKIRITEAIQKLVWADTGKLLNAMKHDDALVRVQAMKHIQFWWRNHAGDRARIEAAVERALDDPEKSVRDQATETLFGLE